LTTTFSVLRLDTFFNCTGSLTISVLVIGREEEVQSEIVESSISGKRRTASAWETMELYFWILEKAWMLPIDIILGRIFSRVAASCV
jgi:hypothetical protein